MLNLDIKTVRNLIKYVVFNLILAIFLYIALVCIFIYYSYINILGMD